MGLKPSAIGNNPQGTHWEPREHVGNKGKKKKILPAHQKQIRNKFEYV